MARKVSLSFKELKRRVAIGLAAFVFCVALLGILRVKSYEQEVAYYESARNLQKLGLLTLMYDNANYGGIPTSLLPLRISDSRSGTFP